MGQQYVIWTNRYNDGKYIPLLEQVFNGASPIFIREEGVYTIYEMPVEPTTFDQKWAVGSNLEDMIASGKMQPQPSILEIIAAHNVAQEQPEPIQESGPVLVATKPFGKSIQVQALLPGSDEMQYAPMFATEDEVKAYIAEKYPQHEIVEWSALYVEYRARVAKSGYSFEDRARLTR